MERESIKESHRFKFKQFEVKIIPYGEKKLGITVIDTINKIQFTKSRLDLDRIGTNTLIKAFESNLKEIKLAMEADIAGGQHLLKISVTVASQFLMPVEEVFLLQSTKSVSESELMNNAIARLNEKLREASKDSCRRITCSIKSVNEKSYNQGINYEPVASIRLPRGKYMITLSFLLRTNSQWMYLYFGNGQQVIPNEGFYVSQNNVYIPLTVRKPYVVNIDSEQISFTTYYSQTYSFSVRNAVMTAEKLPD